MTMRVDYNRLFTCLCSGLLLAVLATGSVRAEVKPLNNLVTELLEVSQPAVAPNTRYTFTNPRDGWVFISSAAATPEAGGVCLVLDSEDPAAAVVAHGLDKHGAKGAVRPDRPGTLSTLETMRRLPAGEHALNVRCEGGAILQGLVVRAIPEIIYSEIGYWVKQVPGTHNPYTWEYLQSIGLAENVNVVLERHEDTSMDVQRWRAQGKKVLTHVSTSDLGSVGNRTADSVYKLWSQADGFRRADRDGIMFDELDGYPSPDKAAEFGAYCEAVRKLFAQPQFKGKVLYPYCNVMYLSEPSRALFKELINAGSKITEDRYLSEMPTEEETRVLLKDDLGYLMREHQNVSPKAQENMIWNLGYMSAPPESLNTNPAVNQKVFLDMLFNFIANDPKFSGTYGIMCYHSAYVDEETLRWSVKLFRHYGIEGRKDLLSSDPYKLPHLQNPDFAEGAPGWSLAPAEEGSMGTKSMEGYGALQGRYQGQSPDVKGQGDSFLWMKRNAKAPNRLSQQIKALKPERLYSLKLLVADYQELLQGKSTNEKHQVGIQIDNAALVPSKCLQETYGSAVARGKFTGENRLWITYYLLVFRAGAETSTLTLSDWVSDDGVDWPGAWGMRLDIGAWAKPAKPGGPVGQELIFNFIELQPYLED